MKIFILPELMNFGGARSYFSHLLKYYSIFQDAEIFVGLEKVSLNNELDEMLDELKAKKIFFSSRPKMFHNIFRKFPFSLIFDLVVLIPIRFKLRPDLFVFSIVNPGLFIGSFILNDEILYVIHSDINGPGKYMFKIKTFLNIFMNDKKKFIVVSEYLKSKVLKFWLANDRAEQCITIYNKASLTGVNVVERKKKSENPITVLTVGHLEWYKNPELWIEVAIEILERNIKQVHFLWLGGGSLYEKISTLVPERYKSQIILPGYSRNVDHYYEAADIYFLPSLRETLGISVIDAMKSKLPCVVSRIGGLPELVTNNYNGFVIDLFESQKFVSAIEMLITDREKRTYLGENGYKRYLQSFSDWEWENKMNILNEKYRSKFK